MKNFSLLSWGSGVTLALLSSWGDPSQGLALAQAAPFHRGLQPIPQTLAQNSQTTVIQSVELDLSAGRLLIRTNQPALFNSGWDRTTCAYRISVTAQSADNLQIPETGANSLLLRILTQQDPSGTTTLLLYPASGVQVGQLQSINPGLVALPLSRGATVLMPPGPAEQPTTPINPDISSVPSLPPATQPRPLPSPRPLPPVIRPRPVGSTLVILDPGHGGPDPGAVGIGGIQEKEIVLDVSYQVSRLLQAQGLQVVMTRTDDRDLGLEPRTRMANQMRATVFLSIHANAVSMSRPEVNGVETFHYSDSSRPLAAAVQDSILESTGMNSRGVKQARFYVLRYTSMPSALVEIGFVTGAQDAPRLADPAFRTQMSQAIARGVLRYLGLSR